MKLDPMLGYAAMPEAGLILPEETALRLEFQSEAAQIQGALSRLVLDTTSLFRKLQQSPELSKNDASAALSRLEESQKLWEHWLALKAPEALQPVWQEISELVTQLQGLFGRVTLLADTPEKEMRDRVAQLQADFSVHLSTMNEVEGRLLSEEHALRGT